MNKINRIERCPACDSLIDPVPVVSINESTRKSYLEYSKKKYNGLIDDWPNFLQLEIDHCSDCGHFWYREQPNQTMLNKMYESGRPLQTIKRNQDRTASPKMISEMSRLMKLIGKSKPRLLDYGSGFGRWARAAIYTGFKVTAYEPSIERGLEKSEVDFTLVHDVDDLKKHLFDVINLEQVLEHVSDPVKLLHGLRDYCEPDAVVRITVPNVLRCPEGDKLWEEWPYNGERAHTMAPFEHLHGFTPGSLLSMIERAGFEPYNQPVIWMQYPKEMIRRLLGRWFPRLGQTFLLIKLK